MPNERQLAPDIVESGRKMRGRIFSFLPSTAGRPAYLLAFAYYKMKKKLFDHIRQLAQTTIYIFLPFCQKPYDV